MTTEDAYRRGVAAARAERTRAIENLEAELAKLDALPSADLYVEGTTPTGSARTYSKIPGREFARWQLQNLRAAEARDVERGEPC